MAVKFTEFRDDRVVADLAAARQLLVGLDNVDEQRVGILGHCWGGRMAWLAACHEPNYGACVVFYGGRIKISLADGATPPIEMTDRIRCPVLGIFGNDDDAPTPSDVDDYERTLAEAGVAHEFHRYDGAGHGFQDFHDEAKYRREQSEDAWDKSIDFLNRQLS
jgi:carboxymethylenebutenolidase